MNELLEIDITELAVLGEQFSLRLMQLGFRLMQAVDAVGRDQERYMISPVCTVPTSSFLMGCNKNQDTEAQYDETPQHVVKVEAFVISAFPLTVAEYACFVLATNHATPEHWNNQLLHLDHPAVALTWHDAVSYAHWLAEMTHASWRLPTEAEWEKAARGTDGRRFP